MKKIGLALAGAALAIVSMGSIANEYEDQVKLQLLRVQNALEGEGYDSTHDFYVDQLRQGGSDQIAVELDAGWDYQIVSVCDADCGDLDLSVYDARGRKVDSDKSDDDVPVVSVSPSSTQQYTLKVEMYHCKDNPCYYGIAVFGK